MPTSNRVGQATSYLRLVRPDQWVKNGFVVAPVVFTPSLANSEGILRAFFGFLVFCIASSCVYVFNDICDRAADRKHPEKRSRPIASGEISVGRAWWLVGALATLSILGSAALGGAFLSIVVVYWAVNLGYSLGLKAIAILDLILISAGFVLRVEAGSVLIGATPSVWILMCTGLLALFLALAKRRDDLVRELDTSHRPSLRGYTLEFLDASMLVMMSCTLVFYAIYTTDGTVAARLGTESLWITVPFVVTGLLRFLQLTLVEKRSGSPTRIVLTDRFLGLTVFGWALTAVFLIFGP